MPVNDSDIAPELRRELETLTAKLAKMEVALRTLAVWVLLYLDPKTGRGAATADAPWARLIIADALGGDSTGISDTLRSLRTEIERLRDALKAHLTWGQFQFEERARQALQEQSGE